MSTKAEKETVIRWDCDDPYVHIWSADPKVIRKVDRMVGVEHGAIHGQYRIPHTRFRWGAKGRPRGQKVGQIAKDLPRKRGRQGGDTLDGAAT